MGVWGCTTGRRQDLRYNFFLTFKKNDLFGFGVTCRNNDQKINLYKNTNPRKRMAQKVSIAARYEMPKGRQKL